MIGNQHVFLWNWAPLAPVSKKALLLCTFHYLLYCFETVRFVEEEKNGKMWRKTGATGITSMSKLCAVTVHILKRQLKENSFLLRAKELSVKRPE